VLQGRNRASLGESRSFASGYFSIFRPQDVPALPPEARTLKGWALFFKCMRGIVPSVGLIFLVLGTIFLGLATPTEAGALGVVGSFALAAMNRTLTWPLVYQGMSTTMRITAFVVFILIGARTFSLVFQGVGGKEWIEGMLTALPGGQLGFLVFVNVFIFLVAFFLDFFEIAFIIVPLLAILKLHIDRSGSGAGLRQRAEAPTRRSASRCLSARVAPPGEKPDYWGAIRRYWVILVVILIFAQSVMLADKEQRRPIRSRRSMRGDAAA
jgi:hypothetical protein